MSVLVLQGGRRLQGVVEISGSKNVALALLSGVVLSEEKVVLRNVPKIADTRMKSKLLEVFGAKIETEGTTMTIDCSTIVAGHPDEEMVRSIRTSFYLLGPLLARVGKLQIPAPGGCKIGARPVDLHLKGLHLMGANISLEGGVYYAEAKQLHGAEVYLDVPSAGATQHLMTTAVLAKGITIIKNAAMEPEVVALAQFLNAMGSNIEGAGTATITIAGRNSVHGTDFRVAADRIQAGTFLLAGAITGGDVTVSGILPEDQSAMVNKLREAGAEIEEGVDSVRVSAKERLNGIRIKTMPHPGFPTDLQQPMAACLALAEGTSVVEETIYESRTGHVPELNRMGANIRVEGKTAMIQGVEKLFGAVVEASDLRAGAALCLAGLVAEGETVVKNVHFIDRGYEAIEETLSGLGASIERVGTEPEPVQVIS